MLHLYNTLTREKEPLSLIDPQQKKVRLYTCGPTVYDYAHLGNFRAYLFEDLLQRHLEARGYDVDRVMNLTDVDDKTIRGARTQRIKLEAFTQRYKEAFFEDCKTLRLRPARAYPAATDPENIAAMIAMIKTLIDRNHAYQAEDGSVYFRISSFSDYGKLAHVDLEEQRPSGRVQNDEYSKEEIGDFALWKAWTSEDGDVRWESPWGFGRPGWHIECSAMATRLLGNQIDIHCGGVDNIFPHHEAEIAQCECVTEKKFVGLWMHCAHLMVNGSKMSKSAGNFYTARELMTRGWSGRELRYALLSVHYRIPLNFTMEGLEASRQALARVDAWNERLDLFHNSSAGGNSCVASVLESSSIPLYTPPLCATAPCSSSPAASSQRGLTQEMKDTSPALEKIGTTVLEDFFTALDDDLNISAGLAVLFDVIRESNRQLDAGTLSAQQMSGLWQWWQKVNSVLALEQEETTPIPEEVVTLLAARKEARDAKNWAESDRLREEIAALGWQIKDTKGEQKVVPI